MSNRSGSLPKPTRLWQIVPDEIHQQPPPPPGPGSTSLCNPSGVQRRPVQDASDAAFVGPYTFAVADSVGHRVLVLDIVRNVCSTVGDGEIWPNGVDVANDGKIYVTDRRTKAVVVYDQRGDRLSVWNLGSEDVLRRPHGIALTGRGEAIVTDTARSVVYVFSAADGRLLRQFGAKGDQLQQLRLPFYCAYDGDRDEILVSDNMNYCVKIFDRRTGGYLRRIGSGNAFGQRQFQCPYGVTVDPHTGNVLVADADSHRVFEYASEGRRDCPGRFLRYTLTSADGCRGPCGLAVGPSCGTLVVTESDAASGGLSNVLAYRLHEPEGGVMELGGGIGLTEQIWTYRTESVV